MDAKSTPPGTEAPRPRPLSPNIQIYRPQLTSVLSIANRATGVLLSFAAIGLVIWLSAAAAGPEPYAVVQRALVSWARSCRHGDRCRRANGRNCPRTG